MIFDAYKREKKPKGISSAWQIYEWQLIRSRRERKEKKSKKKSLGISRICEEWPPMNNTIF